MRNCNLHTFKQDSVNQNTQTQVRTFTLFSKFEIEHYLHLCERQRHSLKVFFTYRLKLNTMKVLVVLALAVFTGEKFRENNYENVLRLEQFTESINNTM